MAAAGIDRAYERRLAGLINSREPAALRGGLKGLEKESLRVTPAGRIAQTSHPRGMGSTLTNQIITTDYSEALIELVTPTFVESWELLQYLCDLHQFVYRHIGDELLWATSMPGRVDSDDEIPIARYGRSNVGRMKEIYRVGLGHRYGRLMQAISGVHFNYSFPPTFWPVLAELLEAKRADQDFTSERYFALLRNYRRYGWLILFLFGNSPVLCESFVKERPHSLQRLTRDTLYGPFATSLRMSDLGYRNKSQAGVQISVNSLHEYIRDLSHAITIPSPEYQRIGVKVADPDGGDYRQLNANVLQIENEYYSFIRPKRIAASGERPTRALARAGVQYVEVRALDVSAFDPVGVNQNKLRFVEAFLALCVLKDSAPIDAGEQLRLDANHAIVAHRGREPGLTLTHEGREISLQEWGLRLIDEMRGLCDLLDGSQPDRPYSAALAVQEAKFRNLELTPAARTLQELQTTGETFFEFALRMSKAHKAYFLDLHPPNERQLAEFSREAEASLERQAEIERADRLGFEEYLAQYFSPHNG